MAERGNAKAVKCSEVVFVAGEGRDTMATFLATSQVGLYLSESKRLEATLPTSYPRVSAWTILTYPSRQEEGTIESHYANQCLCVSWISKDNQADCVLGTRRYAIS